MKLKNKRQEWALFIVLTIVLPLCPIMFEYLFLNNVSIYTLSITIAIYGISLINSYSDVFDIISAFFISFIYIGLFGYVTHSPDQFDPNVILGIRLFALISICFLIAQNSIDRFNSIFSN